MPTKKKRLTIAFDEFTLKSIEDLKLHLDTKQISKVIAYCVEFTKANDKTDN